MRVHPSFVLMTGAMAGVLFVVIGVPAPEIDQSRPTGPSEALSVPQGLKHPPTPGVAYKAEEKPAPLPVAEVRQGPLEEHELNELKLRNPELYLRRLAAARALEHQTTEPLNPETRRQTARDRILDRVAEKLAAKQAS